MPSLSALSQTLREGGFQARLPTSKAKLSFVTGAGGLQEGALSQDSTSGVDVLASKE